LKKHSNSPKMSEPRSKPAKSRGPVQDTKEVLAELVGKLREKLDPKVGAASAGEEQKQGRPRANLHRLAVGVDLGDQWSQYCILGLEGETLAEGQLRTTKQDVAEFFEALNAARVVVEVGTHSAWVREVICSYGHEVLVANPRLMEGSKRRKRKNDRIDANKLARLGRVDPQSFMGRQIWRTWYRLQGRGSRMAGCAWLRARRRHPLSCTRPTTSAYISLPYPDRRLRKAVQNHSLATTNHYQRDNP
jgi:hypothetical protein